MVSPDLRLQVSLGIERSRQFLFPVGFFYFLGETSFPHGFPCSYRSREKRRMSIHLGGSFEHLFIVLHASVLERGTRTVDK